MITIEKIYLGDSVYAEIDRGMIKLTTENGFGPNNTILLEPEVFDRLIGYVDYAKAVTALAKEKADEEKNDSRS